MKYSYYRNVMANNCADVVGVYCLTLDIIYCECSFTYHINAV